MHMKLITDNKELALGSRLSGIQTREITDLSTIASEWEMAIDLSLIHI